ncbi:MAG: hypothetical protein JO206_00235, partial [Solirubrobacterales bacterium]|nr:hypothetical protein [Solirubrobacterales bacterium]
NFRHQRSQTSRERAIREQESRIDDQQGAAEARVTLDRELVALVRQRQPPALRLKLARLGDEALAIDSYDLDRGPERT